MGSSPKKRSKLHFRFNFSSQKENEGIGKTTRDDDIVDSLNRQTRSRNPPVLETVGGNGEPVESMPQQGKIHRHAGRSALLVFLGGFLAVWGYGYVTKAYEIPYLSSLLQNQVIGVGIQTVAANPVPAGAVSAFVLLSALYARHKTKATPISS